MQHVVNQNSFTEDPDETDYAQKPPDRGVLGGFLGFDNGSVV